jgi:hypothetical protein
MDEKLIIFPKCCFSSAVILPCNKEKYRLMNSAGVIKSKAKDGPQYKIFLEFNDFILPRLSK